MFPLEMQRVLLPVSWIEDSTVSFPSDAFVGDIHDQCRDNRLRLTVFDERRLRSLAGQGHLSCLNSRDRQQQHKRDS